MTKQEYIAVLVEQLSCVSAEERESAVEYYTNYFDDAGLENEQNVIKQLGSPKKLAKEIIKATENTQKQDANDEYPQNAPTPPAFTQSETYIKLKSSAKSAVDTGVEAMKSSDKNKLILILIICSFPIWLPVLAIIFSVVFSVVAAVFCVVISFFIAGVALLIGGGFLMVFSLITMVTTAVSSGILNLFIGIILVGVGYLLLCFGDIFFKYVLPKIIHFVKYLVKKISTKIKGVTA